MVIREEIHDEYGMGITLDSLSRVLRYQRRFKEADKAIQRSIGIGEKLGNKRHLVIAHTNRGEILRSWGDLEEAAAEFCKSFEINESLKNRGVATSASVLIKTLLELGRDDEALGYCQRALEIAPISSYLLKQLDRLSSPKKATEVMIAQGTIKSVSPHDRGYLYGFIDPDDGGYEIYFREFIGSTKLSYLTEGARVEVEMEEGPSGARAKNIKLIIWVS